MSDETDPGPGPAQDLARRLPGLFEAAMKRYLDFTGQPPPTDAKDFAAYSSACRASAAHLEQLVKLARLTGGAEPAASPSGPDDTNRLIASAEAALEKAANDA